MLKGRPSSHSRLLSENNGTEEGRKEEGWSLDSKIEEQNLQKGTATLCPLRGPITLRSISIIHERER